MRGFVAAVAAEARLRLPQGLAPETIYFGGGTPSMLSPTHLSALVAGLAETVDFSRLREWSFEANPATFNERKAAQWRQLGITRVSLGVQSMSSRLLRLLGREHSPEQVAESVAILRAVDMPQVNIDLMFSLPTQTLEDWQQTLESALELRPDHLSTYNLTYEEDTAFFEHYGADATDEETDVAMFGLAEELLTAAGFRHYEISNYARTDACRSLHNLACWRGVDYYGLGPGACGTVAGRRYRNVENTAAYTAALVQAGTLPPCQEELLDEQGRRTELLGLRLRTDEGLPAAFLRPQDAAFVAMLLQEKLVIQRRDGGLLLTRAGRLVADEIAVGLM